MGETNVEKLRRIYDSLAEGDDTLFWASLDPDVVWDERDMDWPEADIYHGIAGVRTLLRRWLAGWEDFRWLARDFAGADDRVVVTVTQRARGKASGITIDQERSQVWTFREGKVIAFRSFVDRDEALAAAGISTDPVDAG